MELEVVPGKRVGRFYLGMPIQEAVFLLQAFFHKVGNVELKFDSEEPLKTDLLLDVLHEGMLLRFDSSQQRLLTVEFYDLSKCTLSYNGAVFCSQTKPPTCALVYGSFGPSYPGDFDQSLSLYTLNYPGVSFRFPIPAKFAAKYQENIAIPLEFNDGTTPVASRIVVFRGENVGSPVLCTLPSNPRQIVAEVGKGLMFDDGEEIAFSSSTQQVLSLMGPPSSVFYKRDDHMRIHLDASGEQDCDDYFYNYFQLGLDLLFDGKQHVTKKIILHTNFPSHFDFNRYARCKFKLSSNNAPQQYVTSESKWDEVQTQFGPSGKPVVVHKQSKVTSPFGATLFYGYNGVLFEVMNNGHIASVCLFPVSTMTT